MPALALAAPNEASAAAGEAVARAGGNAVDAALAAALVTMVNEVGIVSLSSGGFVTVQPPDGSAPVTVDGWMEMPGRGAGPWAAKGTGRGAGPWAAEGAGRGAGPWAAEGAGRGAGPWAAESTGRGAGAASRLDPPAELVEAPAPNARARRPAPPPANESGTWDVHTEYGGGVSVTIGPGSVAAHGAVAAFEEAHRRWGRAPWREIVAPALEVARGGFRLGSASRFYLQYVHDDIFGWDDASRAALHDGSGRVTDGRLVVPDLATSLEAIADEGATALHAGEIGRLISDDVLARGGLLTRQDLAAYRPVVRPALQVGLGGWTLGTNPPPSVGGVCVAAMLRLLGDVPRDVVDGGWSEQDVQRLIEVQRDVLGHRLEVLDHSDDLARDALAYLTQVDERARSSGSTAHVSATDADGAACAVTVSSGYGSGMVADGTGIWLNNCLGEQELNPLGLHGLVPGSRLLSNMAPTVARRRDGAALAIGSPGADRISTALAQVVAGVVNGGLSLQDAIDHRRVHVHRAGRLEEDVKVERDLSMYFGGVGAALLHADGRLEAAADPRRDGAIRVIREPGTAEAASALR